MGVNIMPEAGNTWLPSILTADEKWMSLERLCRQQAGQAAALDALKHCSWAATWKWR
jgi:hypothetical protein